MFTFMFNLFTRSVIVLLVAMMSVNYMPNSLFKDFPLEPKLVEPLDYESVIPKEWNTKLSDGQPIYIQLNNILGPESLAISPSTGLIYTGLADGRIIELDPTKSYKVRTVLRFQPSNTDCKDNVATKANECGRFLQLRFYNNSLWAVEANTGLYKIDVKSGSKTFVGPKPLNKVNLYNSFALDPKEANLAYITVSSTKWDILNIMWTLFDQDSSGQVVALDIETGKRAVVLDKLPAPNGIDVDFTRDQLIFSQSLKSRISSIPLEDVRRLFKAAEDATTLKGIEERALIPLLPGFPDNIVVEGDLAYIALPFVKLNGKELFDHLASMPNVRKALGRFEYATGSLLEYVYSKVYQHPLLESAYRDLKCGHINYRVTQSDRSAVLEYNLATGASRLFGSDKFGFVSEAVPDHKGNILLGSFRSPFIVKQKF